MQKAVHDVQPDINKKGIGFKGFIPATFGTQVAYSFSKDTGLKLRQIGPPGTEPRNPNNKPNEQEEQLLYAVQKNHPRVGDHIVEQQLADSRGVRVMLPSFTANNALPVMATPRDRSTSPGIKGRLQGRRRFRRAISIVLSAQLTRAACRSLVPAINTMVSECSRSTDANRCGDSAAGTLDLKRVSSLASDMVESLSRSDQLVVEALAGSSGSPLITNLINVGILATKVGVGLGYYGMELERLALAGLVHDIGLFAFPQSLVTKAGRLTPEGCSSSNIPKWVIKRCGSSERRMTGWRR